MRTGENIHKRSDGRWEARYIISYTPQGKAKYKSIYSKNYSEVKEKLKQATASKNNITNFFNITVEQISVTWLDYIKIYVKQSTYAKYYDHVYNHIIPYFHRAKLQKLTQTMIDEFIKHLLMFGNKKTKTELSIKTAKDIICVLKQILKYARKEKYINETFEFILPKLLNTETKVFSQDAKERLLLYLLSDTNSIKFGFLLMLFTGIRPGELCALKSNNFNLTNNLFKIENTLQRIKNVDINSKKKTTIIITKPKSDSSIREIPLPLFLIDIYKNLNYRTDSYILTGTKYFIEPRTCENKFKRILQEAKIDDTKIYTLRHTFATDFYQREKDIKTLSELLGHSDVSITLKTYVHSNFELKKSYMENLKPCI